MLYIGARNRVHLSKPAHFGSSKRPDQGFVAIFSAITGLFPADPLLFGALVCFLHFLVTSRQPAPATLAQPGSS
ncbi:MAG: hypothetical protein RSE44_27995, partial [Pseudomonas sp.]